MQLEELSYSYNKTSKYSSYIYYMYSNYKSLKKYVSPFFDMWISYNLL